jgi:drug/metabolite transporter (DMT)-like permease
MLRGEWPGPLTLTGIALLVAGVAWAVRVRPVKAAALEHGA